MKTTEPLPKAWTSNGYSQRVSVIRLFPWPIQVLLAASWARKVLPLWEETNSQTDRLRKAVEAAEGWAFGTTSTGLVLKASTDAFAVAHVVGDDFKLYSVAIAAAGATSSAVYSPKAAYNAASVYTYAAYALDPEKERYKLYTIYCRTRGPNNVMFEPSWRTTTTEALAKEIVTTRQFDLMPILADALQEAGCEHDAVLNHLRNDVNELTLSDWVLWHLCKLTA